MKTTFKLKAVLLFVIACMFTTIASAQTPAAKPIPSPRDSVSGMIGSATITINYGSPSVRGREIWGKLEPYDTVWRAGANEATRFTTTKDIWVEGKDLPAGTYGFFVIPSKKEWTVIFNSVANQWGAFKYDATKDVLRIKIKPKATEMQERLIYTITDKGFSLTWDKITIPVKVK
jgi:Protein of unknown function (DUF2911)